MYFGADTDSQKNVISAIEFVLNLVSGYYRNLTMNVLPIVTLLLKVVIFIV